MATLYDKKNYLISSPGIVYGLFFLGLLTMAYSVITQRWMIFGVAMFLPISLITLLQAIEKPMLSYILYAIATCYFSAIYRYSNIEGLSGILDILLAFCLFSIFINVISNREKFHWKQGVNILLITHLIWLVYCCLILISPDTDIHSFVGNRSLFLSQPLIYFISGVLLCSIKNLRITLFLLGVFIITAFFKAYWQKVKGFDYAEIAWLMQGEAWHTHVLRTGIRYFSFYSDAGNFGASMGMFTFIFGTISFLLKNRIAQICCLGITCLAGICLALSGTRGGVAVPFGGLIIFLLISKNIKAIITCTLLGSLLFSFFYFTDIGNDNSFIRRMRTAFRPTEDASFNVRLMNQKRFAYYLADKPFGVGVGGTIVDTESLMKLNEKFIPTDSFYVEKWVEGGIVGLCLYIGLQILVLLRGCYLIMFRIKNNQLRLILAVLLSSVFGMWLNGYVGRSMGFQPSSFLIAVFLSFVLNGPYMDKELEKDEAIL